MKFLLFVALILAVSTASDINEELLPLKCDAAVAKLGVSGYSLYEDFTGSFKFFKFL